MTTNDLSLILKIDKIEVADIYLGCSWRPELGQDAAWTIVKELDSHKVRAIGDVTGFRSDNTRVERIMKDCNGFIAIFPFRKDSPNLTSKYIVRELNLANNLNIPIGIYFEHGVNIEHQVESNNILVKFQSGEELKIEKENFNFCKEIVPNEVNLENKILIELRPFIENVKTAEEEIEIKPYVFLTTRLKEDFLQIRNAIKVAVENEIGLPCIWSDDNRHHSNIQGIRERTRLLIRHCYYFIAEISCTTENSDYISPSRAHEIGMAVSNRKPIVLFEQEPRKRPYFSAGDLDTFSWSDEKDLLEKVTKWLNNQRESFGRRIYNFELNDKVPNYSPTIKKLKFNYNPSSRFISPNYNSLTILESSVVAIGMGLIVFSISFLLNKKLDYGDSLDLAPIIAGFIAIIFSSDLSKQFRMALSKYSWLKILIPFAGFTLLAITIFLTKE